MEFSGSRPTALFLSIKVLWTSFIFSLHVKSVISFYLIVFFSFFLFHSSDSTKEVDQHSAFSETNQAASLTAYGRSISMDKFVNLPFDFCVDTKDIFGLLDKNSSMALIAAI